MSTQANANHFDRSRTLKSDRRVALDAKLSSSFAIAMLAQENAAREADEARRLKAAADAAFERSMRRLATMAELDAIMGR